MKEEYINIINELEKVRHLSSDNIEFWLAREIQFVLTYTKWEHFNGVIEKAMIACRGNNHIVENHFAVTGKMVEIGSGAKRQKQDIVLSRYACYLIAMNGNSAKPEIAAAQNYFAIQTRKMEMVKEDDLALRSGMREKVTTANKSLGDAAKNAGVEKFGLFHNAGYVGLYGMGLKEIKKLKDINDDLLDRAGHAELAANYFRITQADEKLKRENVKDEGSAILAHKNVGETVRKTIEELGGTMPENLPPEPNIKSLLKDREKKKII